MHILLRNIDSELGWHVFYPVGADMGVAGEPV